VVCPTVRAPAAPDIIRSRRLPRTGSSRRHDDRDSAGGHSRSVRPPRLLAACLATLVLTSCSGGSSEARPSRSAVPSRSQAARVEPTAAPPMRGEVSRSPRSVVVTVTVAPGTEPSAEPSQPTGPSTVPVPAPETTSSDSSSPWGWVLLVALLAAAVGVFALVGRGRRRRRWETWSSSTRPAVDAARLSRDLLPANGRDITDVPRWEEIRAEAEQSERSLRTAATTAPTPEAAAAAEQSAEALSGLAFALESARLLQGAQPPPTARQLADAASATTARRAELDDALDRLGRMVTGPS